MPVLSKLSGFVAALSVCVFVSASAGAAELSVATFNVWGAGSNEGKSIAETAAVLNAMDADVLALQEMRAESDACNAEACDASGASVAADLGEALGYHVFGQSNVNDALWANSILSRHPIVGALPQQLGVVINVKGVEVAIFNVHLTDYPYQPYQLAGIEYGSAPFLSTAKAAVESAEAARGEIVDSLLSVAKDVGDMLTVICGDFNEPSHLDWTENAARDGRIPFAVSFPTSNKFENAGFRDAYRTIWTDEVSHPGFTWTPTKPLNDESERHDRIDFVYVKGHKEIISADIAGESERNADIVVVPWPSDHRAVLVKIRY